MVVAGRDALAPTWHRQAASARTARHRDPDSGARATRHWLESAFAEVELDAGIGAMSRRSPGSAWGLA